jgi:hypothetical protein
MASPYTAGALEARDIAEATGVNQTDVNTAATLAGLIADDTGELAAGTATKVTDATTLVIAHSFAAAPDFIMITPILKANAAGISPVANTTSVTLTRTTSTSSWSVSYILGYTA